MSITKEFLSELGISDNVVDEILKERGKEITIEKDKAEQGHAALYSDLEKANSTIEQLQSEVKTLTETNATAEDWKTKFENLSQRIKEEKEQAETERLQREKEESILNRYNSVSVGKDGKPLNWAHDAIKNAYLQKFSEALNDKAYEGKSDADIFNELTKDDADAFKSVQPIVLKGGAPLVETNTDDMTKAREIMGLK